MKALFLIPLMLICAALAPNESNFAELQKNYIEIYKDIAISEMHRSGIPASIKMGQAILESQAGKTDLAKVLNNHFGKVLLKCFTKEHT